MHESVNNVKRVYDAAKSLRQEARDAKPVVLVLDEFDGWFAKSEHGSSGDTDMKQIENILLEVLDGMEDYNGIITMAMTNKPKDIPKGILRRFRYVDIVGQLTTQERSDLLKMYLERSLPVHQDVAQHYLNWAEQLANAPGDVVRKVVDELHFEMVPAYIRSHPKDAAKIEHLLYQRELNHGQLTKKDGAYLTHLFEKKQIVVTPDHVKHKIDQLLLQPAIRMQINAAKSVYNEAKTLLDELAFA